MKAKLTLYQHAWKSKELDPDGAAYGSEAEAQAAEYRCARDELNGFEAADIAEAITEHPRADEVSDDRLAEIREGAELTDDEALIAAEELRGFDSAVYPITVEIDPKTLVEAADDVRQALETALSGVAGLLANWERGDLAGQVHALQGWADDTFTRFPDLDAERWIEAADLRPGDRVDMQGVFAEDTVEGHAAEFEYFRVIGVEREAPDCVRVDFEGADSFGFDPFRWLKAVCTAKDRAAFADDSDYAIRYANTPAPGEVINPDPAELRAGDVFFIDDAAEGRTYPTLCGDGPPEPGYYVAQTDATSDGAEGPLTRLEAYDLAAQLAGTKA